MSSTDTFGVRFTRSWVALYTRRLPDATRERRRVEIESDLWEHHNDAEGRSSARVLERCLRGIPADVRWRYRTLLEEREVRQRSHHMTRNILTNWWGAITAVLGTAVATLGAAGLLFGAGGSGGVVWAVASLIAGVLLLGGLVLLPRRFVMGSRMILVGAVTTVPSLFLIPVAAVVVAGGLWTGHLQLSGAADEAHLQADRPIAADVTARWYVWLFAAPILFAIGLGALVVLGDGQTAAGDDDTSLIASLAYFAWILSWLGAVISAGLGAVFGVKRGMVRHRTRPA